MSKLSLCVLASSALVLTSVSLAAGTPANPVARDEQVVCKRQDDNTGSRMGARKVCKTKSEWEAESRRNREMVDEMSRRGQVQREQAPGG